MHDVVYPVCPDTRECFAKVNVNQCKILVSCYEKDGQCPFCKSFDEYSRGLSVREKTFLDLDSEEV